MQKKIDPVFPILLLVLAVAPAVAAMAWPDRKPDFPVERLVELQGPIVGFTQTGRKIEVRIASMDAGASRDDRARLVVASASGGEEELSIAVRRGQTYLTARLPDALAGASTLRVSYVPYVPAATALTAAQ